MRKKMKCILHLLLLTYFSSYSQSQNIVEISDKICDSINSHVYFESDKLIFKQSEIYTKFLENIILENDDQNPRNFAQKFNELHFKLRRQLSANCDNFLLKQTFIVPFSYLLDIESVFSENQNEELKTLAKDIKTRNKLEILILTLDEIPIDENFEEYVNSCFYDWKIGQYSKNGGLILAFSKNLRRIRISTTYKSKSILSDEVCQEIISKILTPNFKNDNYYNGIYESLIEIQKITN